MSVGGSSLFQITIVPSLPSPSWEITVTGNVLPLPPGTYPFSTTLNDPTALRAAFDSRSGGTVTAYYATSGELVITSSSPFVVRGSMRFTAANGPGSSAAQTMTVESTLSAACLLDGMCQ
jgi:hypothetical protein